MDDRFMDGLQEMWDREFAEDCKRAEDASAPLYEEDIQRWTCFVCGQPCTWAHHGDFFHSESEAGCFELIPVPTALIEVGSLEVARVVAKTEFRDRMRDLKEGRD